MSDNSQSIQWFPGHMAKTRRKIKEILPLIDAVAEVVDARIPLSSRNPELKELIDGKPHIILLNKCDMADKAVTEEWIKYYKSQNIFAIAIDCKSGKGLNTFKDTVKTALADRLESYAKKGMVGKPLRVMVVGIPNVGKSSFINRIAGNTKAKVENRPGVTRDKQWVSTGIGVDLLDMPGILWPKFEDKTVGENLALTGAVKDDILDIESLAMVLCNRMKTLYPETLAARYKLGDPAALAEMGDYELLCLIGKKRGFLVSGGEINTERTADMLLDELRSSKLGRITLDRIRSEE